MKDPTRQLIALLADDLAAELVAALRERPLTTSEAVSATGSARRTVIHSLDLLMTHGIVAHTPRKGRGRGRPTNAWLLTDDAALRAFEQQCDDFKAGLLRAQLEQYEAS